MGILDLIFPKTCLECGKEGRYVCDNCLSKVRTCGLLKDSYSVFGYEGVIRRAIIALKYKYSTEIAKEVADVCIGRLKSLNLVTNNYLLIPIPLHWHKKNIRGFNQTEEVGKQIAKEMGWSYRSDILVKKTSTKPQVGLKGDIRRQNLKGVFEISPNTTIPKGPKVILFDDVATTGSTLQEAAKTLSQFGVKNIFKLTIAK